MRSRKVIYVSPADIGWRVHTMGYDIKYFKRKKDAIEDATIRCQERGWMLNIRERQDLN